MNKSDIKRVIGKLEPDNGMKYRLSEKIMLKQHNKFVLKPIVSIAVSLVMVICLGILGYYFVEKKPNTSPHIIDSTAGIYIPKMELPKGTNALMNMVGLVVYQGRIYTQTGTQITGTQIISHKNAENLLGEKLGTTKENIDDMNWSGQENDYVEFSSSIGIQDVYSVKGYDKNFRIMTYSIDSTIPAQFYECLNGITVKTGADVFDKLKIENHVITAKYENYDSWNNNKQQYKELPELNILNNFINELKTTIPCTTESLLNIWEDRSGTNQKIIYITLNDGSEVGLRLFKDGYINYSYSNILFKMENQAFNKLWNELE
jgi:hypothetical protein